MHVVVQNEILSIQWHNEKYYYKLPVGYSTNETENQTTVGCMEATGLKDWAVGNTALSAYKTFNCCRAPRISNVQSGHPLALWRAEPSVKNIMVLCLWGL